MKWFKTAMNAWWAYTLLAVLLALTVPRAEASLAYHNPEWIEDANMVGVYMGCMELHMANFEEYEFFKEKAVSLAKMVHLKAGTEAKRKSAILYVNASLIRFRKWEESMQKSYCMVAYSGYP